MVVKASATRASCRASFRLDTTSPARVPSPFPPAEGDNATYPRNAVERDGLEPDVAQELHSAGKRAEAQRGVRYWHTLTLLPDPESFQPGRLTWAVSESSWSLPLSLVAKSYKPQNVSGELSVTTVAACDLCRPAGQVRSATPSPPAQPSKTMQPETVGTHRKREPRIPRQLVLLCRVLERLPCRSRYGEGRCGGCRYRGRARLERGLERLRELGCARGRHGWVASGGRCVGE